MKHTILELRYVEAEDYRFGGTIDVTFSLYEGEIMIMTGLLSSGIHTITRILAGKIGGYRGKIFIDGVEVHSPGMLGTLKSGVVVFGLGKLYFDQFTLEDNLALFQGGRLLELVRRTDYTTDLLELLEILDLPGKGASLNAFEQLRREIFMAYASGMVKVMVFSDVSVCCTERALQQFRKILLFLKDHGVGVLLTALNDQFRYFGELADSCIMVRRGMTTTQLYKDADGGFDLETVHHITMGREFRPGIVTALREEKGRGEALFSIGDIHTGRCIPLYPGQLLGIYDEYARIPNGIGEFPAYVGGRYFLEKDGKRQSLSRPGDFAKNRIAVLHHGDAERMVFPNISPMENLSFLALLFFDRKPLFSSRVANYIFEQTIEKYPSLKRLKALRDRSDCRALSYLDMEGLVIAKWLAINPDAAVIFAPSVNDDIKRVEWFRELRFQLLKMGKAVLLISSDYSVFEREPMEILRV